MNVDTNHVILEFLGSQAALVAVVSTRVYVPRLPENVILPAIGFFTRGGDANPHIEKLVHPSVQFDCWADSAQAARTVYRTLFDVLQGIQNETVTIAGIDYRILSAMEEVQGQDLQDQDVPNFYRVLTYFSFIIQADT